MSRKQAASSASGWAIGLFHTTQPNSQRDYVDAQKQAAQVQRQHTGWALSLVHLFPLETARGPMGDRSK